MPCFNSAMYVSRAIRSVVTQGFSDFELVVVDNGSTDATAEIVSGIADPRIRLVAEQNRGVGHARNRGLSASRGAFVAFLDADDTWAPGFLQRMFFALNANLNLALVYCGWQNLGVPSERGQPFVPQDYETPDKRALLIAGCRWPIHAALTRREFIDAAGGFDTRFVVGEDFLLWMTIACFNPIYRVPEVLAYYNHHDGIQATRDPARKALQTWQVQRAFLSAHPQVATELGKSRIRALTYGTLLQEAYAAYWRRDIDTARILFRAVMKGGYGTLNDWRYMLPALLNSDLHMFLIRMFGREAPSARN